MTRLSLSLMLLIMVFAGQLFSQIGTAYVYLKNDSTKHITVRQIHQTGIVDSHNIELPFNSIQSIITPDSIVAYQIKAFLSEAYIDRREHGYSIEIGLLFLPLIKEPGAKGLLLVKFLDGTSMEGEFLSSTEETATYRTLQGRVTVKKSSILSISHVSVSAGGNTTQKVLVKEYNNLGLLVFTIGGGIWAYTLFKDASDNSSAADLLNSIKPQTVALKSAVDDAQKKSNTKLLTGIGVSVVSIVFLVLAIQPTERQIEQPITLTPTSNGLQLSFRF